MKMYEDLKEMLEDQLKKIAKKGDISPNELENAYKAVDILKDIQTIEAMKKADEEHEKQGQEGGYSQRGNNYSREGMSNNQGYSQHYIYPWMSYEPVWNQEPYMGKQDMQNMRGSYNRGGSYNVGNNSNDYSNGSYDGMNNAGTRGRDGDGDGRYSERGYDSYDGGSYDSSYRRGRDARTGRYVSRDGRSYEYSRASEKERMIGKLEGMMEDAKTEKERMAIMQCMEKLEG